MNSENGNRPPQTNPLDDVASSKESEGISEAELPALHREMFDWCVHAALAERDPTVDFDGFVEALWTQLVAAFELGPQPVWPEGLPQPQPPTAADGS